MTFYFISQLLITNKSICLGYCENVKIWIDMFTKLLCQADVQPRRLPAGQAGLCVGWLE